MEHRTGRTSVTGEQRSVFAGGVQTVFPKRKWICMVVFENVNTFIYNIVYFVEIYYVNINYADVNIFLLIEQKILNVSLFL